MTSERTLAEMLTRLKAEANLGDARLATLASERVGIPNYITRSSVRNWASGSSSRVNNWRQLAAIAAVLHLDTDQADNLMRAGGCPEISALLRSAAESDEAFLAHWRQVAPSASVLPAGAADSAEPAASPNPTPSHADGLPSPEVAAGAPTNAIERRRLPIWAVAAALIAIVGGGLLVAQMGSGEPEANLVTLDGADESVQDEIAEKAQPSNESPDDQSTTQAATAEEPAGEEPRDDAPPATLVDLPAGGSSLNGDLVTVSGRASHPDGLEHVQLIFKNQGEGLYWNPVTGIWDSEFVRFVVPVEPGMDNVSWSYQMPVPVASGDYRVRAWALSAGGIIDPVGPKNDFMVENESQLAIEPGTGADPNGPNQIVIEEEAEDPVAAVLVPGNGSTTGPEVTVSGTAAYSGGVAVLEMVLRRIEPEEYWHPEPGEWSSEFRRFVIAVDSPGASQTTWSWTVPVRLEPGEYRARVWARGSDDNRDEARNVSDFTVTTDG